MCSCARTMSTTLGFSEKLPFGGAARRLPIAPARTIDVSGQAQHARCAHASSCTMIGRVQRHSRVAATPWLSPPPADDIDRSPAS